MQHPVAAYLGAVNHFEGTTQAGTLAAGGTDRYLLILQPAELQSTPNGTVYLAVLVEPTVGSTFQPGTLAIDGLQPVLTQTTAAGSYAIFAVSTSGLQEIEVSGANATTAGAYTLQVSVLGDVNADGNVDGVDAQTLAAAEGTHSGQPGYAAVLDLNRDGVIDGTDALLLAANYGFVAAQPPVVTPQPDWMTHQDLLSITDLSAFAADADGNPVYFHVFGAVNGEVMLTPDGQSVAFLPDPGFTGTASFQMQAEDGYGVSAAATVTVTAACALLLDLDIGPRAQLVSRPAACSS